MEQNKFNVILKKEDYEKLVADSNRLEEIKNIKNYTTMAMSVLGLIFGIVMGYGLSKLTNETEIVFLGIVFLEAVLFIICHFIFKPKRRNKNVQKEKIKN